MKKDKVDKDFDGWNKLKKFLNKDGRTFFVHPREIWWCSLGINLGAEVDGKNHNFERPVLILRVYNRETALVLPTTTKEKNDIFHYKILMKIMGTNINSGYLELEKSAWIKLTQARVVSTKRLLRKIDILSNAEFDQIRRSFKDSV